MKNYNKIFALIAFTLAEVLVTLAVIGIVAALTIPTVVKNYQKTQTVTKLKKIYAIFNQATQMATVEYGGVDTWDFCEFDPALVRGGAKKFFDKYYRKHLKVIKEYPINTNFYGRYKTKAGADVTGGYIVSPYNYYVTLTDGMFLGFEPCQGSAKNKQLFFHVDINGLDNPPNIWGKDYYIFVLAKSQMGKVVPAGYSSSYQVVVNSCKSSGVSCTAQIMRDGWQIKYDW